MFFVDKVMSKLYPGDRLRAIQQTARTILGEDMAAPLYQAGLPQARPIRFPEYTGLVSESCCCAFRCRVSRAGL